MSQFDFEKNILKVIILISTIISIIFLVLAIVQLQNASSILAETSEESIARHAEAMEEIMQTIILFVIAFILTTIVVIIYVVLSSSRWKEERRYRSRISISPYLSE